MNTKIYIQNLKCHGCANTIKTQMQKLEGISEVKVDNDEDAVTLTHTSTSDLEMAKQKLSSLGYPSIDDPNSISKKAKSFVSCAVGRINK